jgi:hypothetical protein
MSIRYNDHYVVLRLSFDELRAVSIRNKLRTKSRTPEISYLANSILSSYVVVKSVVFKPKHVPRKENVALLCQIVLRRLEVYTGSCVTFQIQESTCTADRLCNKVSV